MNRVDGGRPVGAGAWVVSAGVRRVFWDMTLSKPYADLAKPVGLGPHVAEVETGSRAWYFRTRDRTGSGWFGH